MNMISTGTHRLRALFAEIEKRSVLVIGDLMLDRYLWGDVTRISPEAPVPVVEIGRASERLGGAANVCRNIANLGARALPLGVVGDDEVGRTLLKKLKACGFTTAGIFVDENRPTTVKTRIIAHNQHVVRFDQESKQPIGPELQQQLLDFFAQQLSHVDAILIEDYNKGLLVPEVIRVVLELSSQGKKMVAVDPKFDHFFDYKHVTLFKPNRKETEAVLGAKLRNWDDLCEAGKRLRQRLRCENLLLTLGRDGMLLGESDGTFTRIPARARAIHDVSGAGDTVIATVTVGLAAGASAIEAATLANYAAGIVCGEVGIVPIDREKLAAALEEPEAAGRDQAPETGGLEQP